MTRIASIMPRFAARDISVEALALQNASSVSSTPASSRAGQPQKQEAARPPLAKQIRTAWRHVVALADPNERLFLRYGLDPDAVAVDGPPGVDLRKDKRKLLGKALQAYEHALKSKLVGNFSDNFHCCNMEFEDGTWELASNIELRRDNTHCSEKAALSAVRDKIIKNTPLSWLQNPRHLADLQKQFKVKTMVLMIETLGKFRVSCSECLDWMSSAAYFTPKTLVAGLENRNGRFTLVARHLNQVLPFWGRQMPSLITGKQAGIGALPFSPEAQATLRQNGIPEATAKLMLAQARQSSERNTPPGSLTQTPAASVLFSNGKVYTAAGFNWWKRISEPPDLVAIIMGFQDQLRMRSPKPIHAVAVAYYGSDPQHLPTMRSLGRMMQPGRGTPDTAIVVIENNTIQARPISAYMTHRFITTEPASQLNAV